jgi:DNA-binding NarL/FixJ family response regulator
MRHLPGPPLFAGSGQPKSAHLTQREEELLGYLADGQANPAIAAKMFLTEATVRVHIHRILSKLGLENRNQLVIFANRRKSG